MCWARAAGTAGHHGLILKHGDLYTTVPQSHVSCCSTHTTRNINDELRGHNKSLRLPASATSPSPSLSHSVVLLLSQLVNLHSIILPLFVHGVMAAFFEVSNNILLVLAHIFLCWGGLWALMTEKQHTPYCRKQKEQQQQQQWANYRLMLHNLHFILCYLHYSAPLESAIKGN